MLWNAAFDSAGNIIVVGEFTGDLDLNGDGAPETIAEGAVDTFVACFSAGEGTVLWRQSFGSPDAEVAAYGVTVDSDDTVIVTGRFHGNSVTFGGAWLEPQGSDAFVVRLAGTDGAHLASANLGGAGNQSGSYVTVDVNGNVVLAGQDQDGQGEFGDILVASLSSDLANAYWEQRLGNDDGFGQWVLDVDTLADGDIVLAGYFIGAVNMGTTELVAAGDWSAFAGRLHSYDGSEVWARNWGEAGAGAFVNSMAVDDCDRIVLGGGFHGMLDFGGTATVIDSGGAESMDAFLAKLGADGGGVWAYGYGDDLSGAGTGQMVERVAVNAAGLIAVAGQFNGAIDLGGGEMVCATCGAQSNPDAFVGAFNK